MLTTLTTVKTRLGLVLEDPTLDTFLLSAIQAVSARFDHECHRTLARTEGFTQEFSANQRRIIAACYPIENVSRMETKSSEVEGWCELPLPAYLILERCVIWLPSAPGDRLQPARVTYTGGYVLPAASPQPGQTPLPADLEHAAVEQVAHWFQNRDRLGLQRVWEYHGTYRQFADLDLLAGVRATLEQHRRWG